MSAGFGFFLEAFCPFSRGLVFLGVLSVFKLFFKNWQTRKKIVLDVLKPPEMSVYFIFCTDTESLVELGVCFAKWGKTKL